MAKPSTEFSVEGMTCGGCEKAVVRTIAAIAGVADVSADRLQNKAVVTWAAETDPVARSTATKTICEAVTAAGFDCSPLI